MRSSCRERSDQERHHATAADLYAGDIFVDSERIATIRTTLTMAAVA
jgi:hypothetical protein